MEKRRRYHQYHEDSMQMAVAQTKAEIIGEARSEFMKIQMMQNAQLQDSNQITNELRQRTMLIEQYADTEYKSRISQLEHEANTAILHEQAAAQKAVQETKNYADQQWIQREQALNQNASNITAEARQQHGVIVRGAGAAPRAQGAGGAAVLAPEYAGVRALLTRPGT